MHLLAIGLNHHSAPVEIRERLALGGERLPAQLAALRDETQEAVILATCNRTELYAVTAHLASGLRATRRLLANQLHAPAALDHHLYECRDEGAVRQLLRVAAGLDSLILGEPQILGQVRDAVLAARQAGTSGPVLDRLFETALAAGKEARTVTGIARGAASIGHAAIEVARRELGGLGGRAVLVIGAGKMATLAARALLAAAAEGGAPSSLVILNRSPERATALASELGGTGRSLLALPEEVSRCDVIIASTGSSTPLITTRLVARRGGRPLLILDLAVPRDVEPGVAALPGITLRNIDDLRDTVAAGVASRGGEVAHVELLLERYAARFWVWQKARAAVPTIAALQARATAIRDEELSKTLGRLGHLNERDRNAVCALAVAVTNKLLHAPLTRLKQPAGAEFAHAARELFGLSEQVSAGGSGPAPSGEQTALPDPALSNPAAAPGSSAVVP